MLTISVKLDRNIIALPVRIDIARLHRPADSQVKRQLQHVHVPVVRYLRSSIVRPVINHQHIDFRCVLLEIADHAGKAFFFII